MLLTFPTVFSRLSAPGNTVWPADAFNRFWYITMKTMATIMTNTITHRTPTTTPKYFRRPELAFTELTTLPWPSSNVVRTLSINGGVSLPASIGAVGSSSSSSVKLPVTEPVTNATGNCHQSCAAVGYAGVQPSRREGWRDRAVVDDLPQGNAIYQTAVSRPCLFICTRSPAPVQCIHI